MVSMTTSQLCYYSVKVTIDNMKINVYVGVPIKLYIWNKEWGWI